jgi:hypothetical protein
MARNPRTIASIMNYCRTELSNPPVGELRSDCDSQSPPRSEAGRSASGGQRAVAACFMCQPVCGAKTLHPHLQLGSHLRRCGPGTQFTAKGAILFILHTSEFPRCKTRLRGLKTQPSRMGFLRKHAASPPANTAAQSQNSCATKPPHSQSQNYATLMTPRTPASAKIRNLRIFPLPQSQNSSAKVSQNLPAGAFRPHALTRHDQRTNSSFDPTRGYPTDQEANLPLDRAKTTPSTTFGGDRKSSGRSCQWSENLHLRPRSPSNGNGWKRTKHWALSTFHLSFAFPSRIPTLTFRPAPTFHSPGSSAAKFAPQIRSSYSSCRPIKNQ